MADTESGSRIGLADTVPSQGSAAATLDGSHVRIADAAPAPGSAPVTLMDSHAGTADRGPARAKAADESAFPVTSWDRYTLVRLLGQGGMGSVYEARDLRLGRAVALKFIRGGDPRLAMRLMQEARAQARIEHESVCKVFEVGEVQGKAYIAMQLVVGRPLDKVAKQMSLDEKVIAVRDIAVALHEAHKLGILHRDIKPSNILVETTGDGRLRPIVMDFGLARDEGAEHGLTQTGALLGTPAYMSPEQARGDRGLDRRADVYSLGATLYELLAGVPPFTGDSMMTVLLSVLHEEPLPLRARVRSVPQDLETVAAKCLRKDPGQRYDSAKALAEDLDRYIRGEPIEGRRESVWRRAGKFVRRNRLLVAALSVVLATLTAATVVSVRQARVADEQARRAQRRFDDVRRLANSMLFEVDGKIQNLEGATEARELIVSRALQYLDGLASEAGDDAALSRELAAAYTKIGDIQGSGKGPNLGRLRDAAASYGKAKQILDGLVASGQGDEATRWALVRTLFGISNFHWESLEIEPARASALAALEVVATLPEDGSFDYRLVARGYSTLVNIEEEAGDVEMFNRHAEASLDVATRWARSDPSPEGRYWIGVAREMRAMGTLATGDPDAALRELHEARAIFSALVAEHESDASYRRELWFAHMLTAISLAGNTQIWFPNPGDRAAAEHEIRDALALMERQVQRDPSDVRAVYQLVGTLDELAANIAESDPAAALPSFLRARAIFASVSAKGQKLEHIRSDTSGHCAMALPLARQGRRADALRAIEDGLAMAIKEAESGRGSLEAQLRQARCRFQAARARHALGQDAAAAQLLEETAAGLRSLVASRPTMLGPYIGVVETLDLLGSIRPEQRCMLLEQALTTWRSWPGKPTSYTRRRDADLDAARSGCRTGP